jgi:cytochrome c oxidase assembly protein subunit 11
MSDAVLPRTLPPLSMAVRNRRVMIGALAVALASLSMGFAAVPLYRIFCQVTGFGGTTQRAENATGPGAVVGKTMSIRFDSNVTPGMPWQFHPERETQTVTIGQKSVAIFVARNLSDKPVTGTAAFNVTPTQSGRFFSKIQCFCFTQQTLQPGQEVRMPVIYYVDPAILADKDNKDVQQITLSYTFYPVENAKKQG